MNTITVVLVFFVGAAITAPQFPAQYQQSRLSNPYRPQQPTYQDNRPAGQRPVTSQLIVEPSRRPVQQTKARFRTTTPPVPTIESPVQEIPLPPRQPSIPQKPYIVIMKQSQEDNFDGSFSYTFESENGISEEGLGYLKDAGTENEAQVIIGKYKFIAPDGTPVETTWVADETGFHAEGAHIPVSPVLPEMLTQRKAYQRSFSQTDDKTQHEEYN